MIDDIRILSVKCNGTVADDENKVEVEMHVIKTTVLDRIMVNFTISENGEVSYEK